MNFRKLNEKIFIAGQISLENLSEIAISGIRSIICNRPDEEGENQLQSECASNKAKELGLHFCYLPVDSRNIKQVNVINQHNALINLPGPILMYCKSGTRSATLWALSKADKMDHSKLIQTIEKSGLPTQHVRYYLDKKNELD